MSPVPENFSGLGSQNKSSTSDVGVALGRHGHFSSNLVAGGPMHRSMEIVSVACMIWWVVYSLMFSTIMYRDIYAIFYTIFVLKIQQLN